jgi:hypothetical protein
MLYALTFRTTEEGYLRMASLPIAEQAKGDPVVAMQPNIQALEAALKLADIRSSDRDSILSFAKISYESPGVDVCCDQLELSADQLSILCMAPGRQRSVNWSTEPTPSQ